MSELLVIIGGNTAGLAAALSARRRRSAQELRVLVLEAGFDTSYGACGMPYNLADPQRPVEDLLVRGLDHFRQQGIEVATGHRVLEVNPAARRLRVVRGGEELTLGWDHLVVATGAQTLPLVVPGLPQDRIFTFRTLEDLRRLKSTVSRLRRVAVVGAGAVGLELCEAFRALGVEVALVEAQDLPLPGFPHALRLKVQEHLLSHGLELHLACRVRGASIQEGGLRLSMETTDRGTSHALSCDAVVNATGQAPATDFLPAHPQAKDSRGALLVDPGMATAWPGIWAAGDGVLREHAVPALPGEAARLWNPQAREARRGGRVAGWNAAGGSGEDLALALSPGTFVLRLFDGEVARCGRLSPNPRDTPAIPSASPAPRGLLGQPMATTRPGLSGVQVQVNSPLQGHGMPRQGVVDLWLEGEPSGGLRGAASWSEGTGAALRMNVLAALLRKRATVEDLLELDLVYSPPFGPIEDPLLKAAAKLQRLLRR